MTESSRVICSVLVLLFLDMVILLAPRLPPLGILLERQFECFWQLLLTSIEAFPGIIDGHHHLIQGGVEFLQLLLDGALVVELIVPLELGLVVGGVAISAALVIGAIVLAIVLAIILAIIVAVIAGRSHLDIGIHNIFLLTVPLRL